MTLKQALWEIVRDENIIITNQNIDWLLDRASKKATGNAQALKESILERKQVIEENIPCALTSEEKVSEKDESNEELFKQALVEGLNRRFDKTLEEAKKIEQIEEMVMELAEAHHKMDVAWTNYFCDCEKFPKPKTEHLILAEHLYNAGYRKQSEVKCIYAYDGEVEEYCVQSPCPNFKTIEQAKQEVAREIFEEIEKDGKYAISFVEKHKSYSEEVRQAKLECYKDIQTYIAELKKKYTESEDKE